MLVARLSWPMLVLGLLLPYGASGDTITLDRALELAFERSPAMRSAGHSLEVSKRNLQAQQAALRSRFGLTLTPYQTNRDRVFNPLVSAYNTQEETQLGGAFTINQPIVRTDGTLSVVENFAWREAASSFTGSVRERTYRNSLFLRYSQPLFTYNRTRLQLQELELALENARLSYAIQKLQIESQVTRLFYNLFQGRENVRIAGEELANATSSFEIIQSKVEAGIAAEEELFQADLNRANRRATLNSARLQYENALDEFKLLLGQDLVTDLDVAADLRKQLIDVDLEKAIAHGLEYRMELRQADIGVRNALNDLVRTQAQNEFKGNIELTYGLTNTDGDLVDLLDSPTRNQGVAVQLTIPLFDWGEKEHRVAASHQQVAQRRLSSEDERNRTRLGIRQAHRDLQNQRIQIEIAEKNVANARRTYEINLERYRNGDLSSKDIEFYQTQLAREQLNEVGALINYQLFLLDLKVRALYDFVRDEPVLVSL